MMLVALTGDGELGENKQINHFFKPSYSLEKYVFKDFLEMCDTQDTKLLIWD